ARFVRGARLRERDEGFAEQDDEGRHALRVRAMMRALLVLATTACASTSNVLRVCADPNNLPLSNAKGEGLENQIASLVARDLGRRVQYTWWAQRRGFVRNTLNANECDLVPGTASGVEVLATTRPYYKS